MSNLKLYRPEADEEAESVVEEPVIFSIADYLERRPPRRERPAAASGEAVDRARILHINRRCPWCKHPVVQPVELDDGRFNHNRSRVPGTATLVGFHCDGCYREWPA